MNGFMSGRGERGAVVMPRVFFVRWIGVCKTNLTCIGRTVYNEAGPAPVAGEALYREAVCWQL